jgi:uncharacterized membrane protein
VSAYEKGLITILSCNMIFALLAIPLILRKVPRNIVYGYRTRATLRDDYVWYEANACFGRVFLIANAMAAIAALVLYFARGLSAVSFLKFSIALLAVPLFVSIFATSRFIRSLPQGDSVRRRPY